MKEKHREPEVPEEKVPAVECLDGRARITSKELAPIHSVRSGTLQNACSTRRRMVADLGKSARMRIARLMNNLVKRSKMNGDKIAVAMLKKHDLHERTGQLVVNRDLLSADHRIHDNWVVSFRSWSRRSCRQSYGRADMRKPIRRLNFTKAIARHADFRDQNPSLGYICPGEPHERTPTLQNLRIGLRRQNGKSDVPAKQRGSWPKVEIQGENRATFFSPSENRCLPASTLKPEEREFVVGSGASMHMISKKDLSDGEMDTLTKSCSLTKVITANGEVQTHEEATVYVKELERFLTMKVLENTPAVFIARKALR